uniref:Uncharacterized protein n=1 Tax=Arundo donax TaxID=35708 RepID=A0A0A9FRF9_ARUDO
MNPPGSSRALRVRNRSCGGFSKLPSRQGG